MLIPFVDLSEDLWHRYSVYFGLPVLAAAAQFLIETRANRGQRTLLELTRFGGRFVT